MNWLKSIFGKNWKTTLAAVGVLVGLTLQCVVGGGNLIDCIYDAWPIAIAGGSVAYGLKAAADASNLPK